MQLFAPICDCLKAFCNISFGFLLNRLPKRSPKEGTEILLRVLDMNGLEGNAEGDAPEIHSIVVDRAWLLKGGTVTESSHVWHEGLASGSVSWCIECVHSEMSRVLVHESSCTRKGKDCHKLYTYTPGKIEPPKRISQHQLSLDQEDDLLFTWSTWAHLRDVTQVHFDSLEVAWTHWISPALSWSHLFSLAVTACSCLVPLRLTWLPLDSLWCTWSHMFQGKENT